MKKKVQENTKPRRPRARNAKPKIERAALKLFTDIGIDAATTREIAETAEVSEGALYRHYVGKEALAFHLFSQAHDQLVSALTEAWREGATLEDKISNAVASYLNLFDEDPLLFGYHLSSLDRHIKPNKKNSDIFSEFSESLKSQIERGEIVNKDPKLLASMTAGIVYMAARNHIEERLSGPLSTHSKDISGAILAVLAPA